MTADPAAAQREQARDWGRTRLAASPWASVEHRLTLLLVDPPTDEWASPVPLCALWLAVDGPEVPALPSELREPLLRDGSVHEPTPADVLGAESTASPSTRISVFRLDRLEGLIAGVGVRSLEARWSVRHGTAIHDPLRRHEAMSGAAARLPEGGMERAVRPLFVQACLTLAAVQALDPARAAGAVVALGEAAAAVTRLACVIEEGSHPPAQWLLPAARTTELGARLASWLDDIGPALGGEQPAAARVIDGCAGIRRAVEAAVRPEFSRAAWFQSPDTWALRPPR
ncbi:MAG: hypothetical protein QF664_05520 [Dehalococcoidia bacterium]|nr:hypothetical protein [Dehalococcoidia bacterium]